MNEYFKNNDSIVDLKTLLEMAEGFQTEIDEYCDFMKQTFLATSGIN